MQSWIAMVAGGVVLAGASAGLAWAQAAASAAQTGPRVSTMVQPANSPELMVPPEKLTAAQVQFMQKRLQDWAGLQRYAAEDAAMPAPKTGERRVVFFGDSITDAWGRLRGKFFPDEPWVNRGISGQTTPQMLLRFEQDVIGLRPEAVVILAGINDIAGNSGAETLPEIEANFRAMVAVAEREHVRVVLCSVLPAGKIPWRLTADPREEITALNGFLKQLAGETGAMYLDYYAAMVGTEGAMRPELTVDGVHPNDAGYAVMEPMARAAVAKVLAEPRP